MRSKRSSAKCCSSTSRRGGATRAPPPSHKPRSGQPRSPRRTRHDRLGRGIRSEFPRRVHAQHFGKLGASTVDAAFDGPYRASRYGCRLLIGKPGGADQNQGLALIRWKQIERPPEVLHVQMALLPRMDGEFCRLFAFAILDLAPPPPAVGKVGVAQDGEEPGAQIRTLLEAFQMVPGFQQRFLHEIVGPLHVPTQGNGKGAQIGDQPQEGLFEGAGVNVHRCFSLASSASSNFTKRSGTGSSSMPSKMARSCRPSCACKERSIMPVAWLSWRGARCISGLFSISRSVSAQPAGRLPTGWRPRRPSPLSPFIWASLEPVGPVKPFFPFMFPPSIRGSACSSIV